MTVSGLLDNNRIAKIDFMFIRVADFLLVVMGFEKNEELFMRTCFTTKFSDYCSWGKPIVLWSPAYTAPARLIGGDPRSLVILQNQPAFVVEKIKIRRGDARCFAQDLHIQTAGEDDGVRPLQLVHRHVHRIAVTGVIPGQVIQNEGYALDGLLDLIMDGPMCFARA